MQDKDWESGRYHLIELPDFNDLSTRSAQREAINSLIEAFEVIIDAYLPGCLKDIEFYYEENIEDEQPRRYFIGESNSKGFVSSFNFSRERVEDNIKRTSKIRIRVSD